MECIGTHLSYLTEYSKAPFQDSEKLQQVRCTVAVHMVYSTFPFITCSRKIYQALAGAYCDLLEFYIKVRQLLTKKKGEHSCKYILEDYKLTFLTYSTIDVRGFKLSLKVIWEPFEAQFGSIETRFKENALSVVCFGNIDHQKRTLEYQNQTLERQMREGKNSGLYLLHVYISLFILINLDVYR